MFTRSNWDSPTPTSVCRRLVSVAALVFALAACVPDETTEAMMVLEDVAAGGAQSRLKATTPAPTGFEIGYRVDRRRGHGNLYQPNQPIGGNLVLVPGFTPHGKDDRRVINLAQTFARARFRVLVPDVPGSRLMRVGLDDAQVIADAAFHLSTQYPVEGRPKTALLAISYAVGPAVLATLDPRLQDHVDFVVGIGGYHDTVAVTRFVTAGHFREPGSTDWQKAEPHPAAKWFSQKQYRPARTSQRSCGTYGNGGSKNQQPDSAERRSGRPPRPPRTFTV